MVPARGVRMKWGHSSFASKKGQASEGQSLPATSEHTRDVPYAELHCVSNFSFLRGASHAEELVTQARELGYTALAITDECSLAGVVRAHAAIKKPGGAQLPPHPL